MPPSDPSRPRIAVIIPAYSSGDTIARCLEKIEAQSFRDFETIVVDSSPDEATVTIVRQRFPNVRFHHHSARLLPHGARNHGVTMTRAELLVFTDPDVYPHSDWLARLVAAYESHGGVVVGAIDCHGAKLVDRAMHLCKFSKWLPYGDRRLVDMSPTANMLVSRAEFEAAGGLPGDQFLGDVVLTRALRARGTPLYFEPVAVVAHHHLDSFRDFLRIRFQRGIQFGELRAQWMPSRLQTLAYLAVTVLPVRLTRIALFTAGHARRGKWWTWLAPFPLAMLGHVTSLAGEAVAYVRAVLPGGRSR